MRAQVQAGLGPRGKVVGHGDGTAAGPFVDAVGDVLPEGGRARDGRLVDLLVLPDLVRAAVALEGAQLLALRRPGPVGGPLLDIILDERVAGPAVHGDQDRARGLRGAALEGDVPAARVRVEFKAGTMSIVTYLAVPVLQPFPTTKSPAPEKLTE